MDRIMNNGPLTAIEHFKLVMFLPLLITPIFFLVGIIPAFFLAFGYFMMKKNNDFSSIEASVKAVNIYCKLAIVLLVLVAAICFIFLTYEYLNNAPYIDTELFWVVPGCAFFASIIYAYILIVKYLYLKPLQNHSEWVVVNGTFSNKPKKRPQDNLKTSVEILQSEKLKPYSVADELLKWAKLQDDGLISVEEFNEARSKLLNRA